MDEHCTHAFRKIVNVHKWKSKDLFTYWFVCKSCGHRWKLYYDRTNRKEVVSSRDLMPPSCRRLTELEVRLALLDPRSAAAVARDIGVSKQAIGYIRTGVYRADLWPEIQREPRRYHDLNEEIYADTDGLTCRSCSFWEKGACSLAIPEATVEGFAMECAYFQQQN